MPKIKHYGLCTKCNRKGMFKINGRQGYTKLKCRYCGKQETYSS
jgi:DNA-directed RNA polymerase subunit RPC12/RpoP